MCVCETNEQAAKQTIISGRPCRDKLGPADARAVAPAWAGPAIGGKGAGGATAARRGGGEAPRGGRPPRRAADVHPGLARREPREFVQRAAPRDAGAGPLPLTIIITIMLSLAFQCDHCSW